MKEIAWEEIYRQQSPKLLGLCRRYVRDIYRAEDLLHDAFLTAINKQQTFTGAGAIEGWLRQITLNTVLMHLRSEKKLTRLFREEMPEPAEEAERPEGHDPRSVILAADFDRTELLEAIDVLPEHHRVVFNLYVFEAFSHQQIADVLFISPGTSKSHLLRARRNIQKILLQKAQEMKEQRKRAAIFPFFVRKPESYLDDLYKNKLSDHPIQPTSMPEHLRQSMQQAPPLQVAPAVTGWKLLLFGGATLVGVAVLAAFLFLKNAQTLGQTPALQDETPPPTMLTGAPALPMDSIALQTLVPPAQSSAEPLVKQSEESGSTQQQRTRSKEPTIVRKKVIVKDTLYQIIE